MKLHVTILVFLAMWLVPAHAGDPSKPALFSHITPGGTKYDPIILQRYGGRYQIIAIGDDQYVRPRHTGGQLADICKAVSGEYIEGFVAVAYIVAVDGSTADQVVLESSDERLNEVSLRSSQSWRFEPAKLKDKLVPVVAVQEFNFRKPKSPNQALEPTTTAVTIPAAQEVAPAVVVAHL